MKRQDDLVEYHQLNFPIPQLALRQKKNKKYEYWTIYKELLSQISVS